MEDYRTLTPSVTISIRIVEDDDTTDHADPEAG